MARVAQCSGRNTAGGAQLNRAIDWREKADVREYKTSPI